MTITITITIALRTYAPTYAPTQTTPPWEEIVAQGGCSPCSGSRFRSCLRYKMAASSTAAATSYTLDGPAWRLQHLGRVPTNESCLSSGGFAQWTNVPPVGVPDPVIADQMRSGRRYLTGPTSGPAPEPLPDRGKHMVGAHTAYPGFEGKRSFPGAGAQSTKELEYRGVRRVPTRARRDEPSMSDPNAIAGFGGDAKPESVKFFPGHNQVNYQAWQPEQLSRAEKGDWNWNSQLGFRKLSVTSTGEPKRTESTPVAFPGYRGYPPDRAAATNTRIDYVRAAQPPLPPCLLPEGKHGKLSPPAAACNAPPHALRLLRPRGRTTPRPRRLSSVTEASSQSKRSTPMCSSRVRTVRWRRQTR